MEIEVNNVKIHYEIMGSGKPIILLNPNSTNTKVMKPIANKLAKDYRVYLFDRRGCGKSQKKCILNYEESSKDVYQFITKLNIDKPFLLGSSGGATVALNVAINYPNSISKLVSCSGVTKSNIVKKTNIYTKFFKKIPYPGKKENKTFEKMNLEMKTLEKIDLEKIIVPTLIVNGGKKDVVPMSEAKYLADNIKNATLIILEEESHFSYMINVKWYNKLKEFLER